VLGADRPAGLMQGYQGEDGKLSGADGNLYRSGDVVFVDGDGISPSSAAPTTSSNPPTTASARSSWKACCLEHESVAEAAVVPSPDPIRLAIPKAYVLLVTASSARRPLPLDLQASAHPALRRSSASGALNS